MSSAHSDNLDSMVNFFFAGSMLFVLLLFGLYLLILKKQNRLNLQSFLTRVKAADAESIVLVEKKRLSADSILYVVEIEENRVVFVESNKSIAVLPTITTETASEKSDINEDQAEN